MSDIVDRAEDLIELMQEAALRTIQNRSGDTDADPIGECLYCGAVVAPNKRWCDAEHRDAWEYERRRHGK